MSFFYNEAKAEPKKPRVIKRGDIPIASLRQLGCSACPRDADAEVLYSPKMRPEGREDARVYLLGTSPSKADDEDDGHWLCKAGNEIYEAFGKHFMDEEVRSNYITQCNGDQTAIEVECCRGRIVADIEAVKPLVIVGVGDAPLYWCTPIKNGGALPHRGTLFTVRIGNHTCYYYQILWPNYVHLKFGRSAFEQTLKHDVARIKKLVTSGKLEDRKPRFFAPPYDSGIEYITGNEPGDMQRLESALARIAAYPKCSGDIETNGLRPFMLADPQMMTCAVGTFKDTVAFSVDHPDGWGSAAQRRQVWGLLAGFLASCGRLAAHNASFEMEWLARFFGPELLLRMEWDDTMAQAHTIDEREGTKALEKQTIFHFGFDLKAQSEVNVRLDQWWLKFPLMDILRYNAMDTKWTDLLRDTLQPLIEDEPAYVVEYERKVRLAPALVLMEVKGLPVDFEYADDAGKRLDGEILALEVKIARCQEVRDYSRKHGTFSPSNPDHVLRMLKDMGRDEVKVTDRDGAESWTTGEEVLLKIPPKEVPSIRPILDHRAAAKLQSTYVLPITSRKIVCPDGLLRPKYSSMRAVTGRLAAEDPNIQNWPTRKHKEIRGMVAAGPGQILAPCDYGQLEFRVVGMASGDDNLVRYCWTGYDAHGYWAKRMIKAYGPIVDWIIDEFPEVLKKEDTDAAILKTLRQEAKNGWVFPQLFGSATKSCAARLHLPDDIADKLGKEFWDEFKGVKKWQDGIMKGYEKHNYVETLSGRRRRGAMTRQEAINLPIQGTGCDIVTAAQVALTERAMIEDDYDLIPNLNVHDDLTFVLDEDTADQKLKIIVPEMCKPRFDFVNVPLIIEVKTGRHWHKVEEIGVYRGNELFGIPNPYS